jgi:DNA invertase Pin-like site-specific DNA recombinase
VDTLYVRQSTVQQISRHQESTRLQYGLVERALALGWPRERVLVIDEDQGLSGRSAEGRLGFQRLVAEVGLNRVGIVLGIEMSRLARSCRDWYQRLEVCGVFGTLIGDLDGIYDPSDYNDRLLLGLKGQMSEAESHVLKQRMLAGKRAKAARGELGACRTSSKNDPGDTKKDFITRIMGLFLAQIRRFLPLHPPI